MSDHGTFVVDFCIVHSINYDAPDLVRVLVGARDVRRGVAVVEEVGAGRAAKERGRGRGGRGASGGGNPRRGRGRGMRKWFRFILRRWESANV